MMTCIAGSQGIMSLSRGRFKSIEAPWVTVEHGRPPGALARYTMLKHKLRQENPDLAEMVEKTRSHALDGEGVDTVEYSLDRMQLLPAYTRLEVRLASPPPQRKVMTALPNMNT